MEAGAGETRGGEVETIALDGETRERTEAERAAEYVNCDGAAGASVVRDAGGGSANAGLMRWGGLPFDLFNQRIGEFIRSRRCRRGRG